MKLDSSQKQLLIAFLVGGATGVATAYVVEQTLKSQRRTALPKPYKPRGDTRGVSAMIDHEFAQVVGMDSAKNQLKELVAQVEWQSRRARSGKNVQPSTNHLILVGPPGTGKTTLARIYGRMLKEMGILSEGHFVEVDRSHLIAGYIGQSALKVQSVLKRARGGVLFIDEAYSLQGDEFAAEAVATLIKGIEDNRDDLVVILAGYPDKMTGFLDTNPGLRSRFPHVIAFDHYDGETLALIFDKEIAKRDLVIQPDAQKAAHEYLFDVASNPHASSGNGRLVRTFVEAIERKMAARLASGLPSDDSNVDHDSIVILADISAAQREIKV